MGFRTFVLAGLLVVTLGVAGAARPPQLVADMAFARAIDVHGGIAVRNARTLTLRGQSAIGQQARPVLIRAMVNGNIRFDYGEPVQRSIVTIPRGRFEVIGASPRPQPPHVGVFSQFDILSILGLTQFAEADAPKSMLGLGSVGGQPTQRFKAQTRREQVFYKRPVRDEAEFDFFDNRLLAGIARRQYADRSLDLQFTLAYAFSDYRNVDGLLFPFRITKFIDGTAREAITVSAVELNTPISNDIFER